MKARIISSLLLAAMLASAVSCGGSGEQTETSDTTTAPAETEFTGQYLDLIPDADYGGREFVFGVSTYSVNDIEADEINGDILNDAMWNRNDKIENKFNVDIQSYMVSSDPWSWYKTLINGVLADEKVCDVAGHFAYLVFQPVTSEIYQDWRDVNNVEFDEPWWAGKINDSATINDTLYGISGYIGMSLMQYTQAMFFNQRHVEDYGTTPQMLYDMVRDGTWTYDNFTKIIKNMYVDLNNDGTRGEEDFYGFGMGDATALDIWQDAFDIPITGRDSDGNIEMKLMSEKRVDALERINSLITTNDSVQIFPYKEGSPWQWRDQYFFSQGQLAFTGGTFLAAYDIFREMDDVYGVIPFPKWDEAQDKYYSALNDSYMVWGIPKTTADTDFVGLICDAMARETYQNVYPKYYDVALKEKFSTDENYAEMVDIVMDGVSFDCAYMFAGFTADSSYVFRKLLLEGSTDLASKYAEMLPKLEEGLKKFDLYY